jgi:hypothetical protein|tara:strand:- start:160 stop:567 length:408 start_codon:yes stop_codon:yes gene_type:complete
MADLEELVPERFRVFFNQQNSLFRILDTWHPSIKNLKLEENPELPEESPALKNLSSEEVNAIVGELIRLGWLDKMIGAKKEHQENVAPMHKSKPTVDIIVDRIAEITLDDGEKPEPHSSVVKDAISALKEIASKL